MNRTLKPCGTEAAYQRHLKAREAPCEPCRGAHRKMTRAQYLKQYPVFVALPSKAPEGAHHAPCFANPLLWDPQGDWEPKESALDRWREASKLCVTACPVFRHCAESRQAATGSGVWAGQVWGGVS